jgi:hypothetical protein
MNGEWRDACDRAAAREDSWNRSLKLRSNIFRLGKRSTEYLRRFAVAAVVLGAMWVDVSPLMKPELIAATTSVGTPHSSTPDTFCPGSNTNRMVMTTSQNDVEALLLKRVQRTCAEYQAARIYSLVSRQEASSPSAADERERAMRAYVGALREFNELVIDGRVPARLASPEL